MRSALLRLEAETGNWRGIDVNYENPLSIVPAMTQLLSAKNFSHRQTDSIRAPTHRKSVHHTLIIFTRIERKNAWKVLISWFGRRKMPYECLMELKECDFIVHSTRNDALTQRKQFFVDANNFLLKSILELLVCVSPLNFAFFADICCLIATRSLPEE